MLNINTKKRVLYPLFPYTIDHKSFPDRWAAIAWICANQLHKHNMNEIQRAKLLQEEYDARLNTRGGDHKSEQFMNQKVENRLIDSDKTAEKNPVRHAVAVEHNLNPSAVRDAVFVGRGIDKAAEVDPDFKRDVLSGAVKAKKSDLAFFDFWKIMGEFDRTQNVFFVSWKYLELTQPPASPRLYAPGRGIIPRRIGNNVTHITVKQIAQAGKYLPGNGITVAELLDNPLPENLVLAQPIR